MNDKRIKKHLLGGNTKRMWIPVSQLNGDHNYQRPLRDAWAQEIADNLDPDKFLPPQVSQRANGRFFVIDGQHRVAACRLLGWDKQGQAILCDLRTGLSVQDEADLYLIFNTVKNQRFFDRFHARITKGDGVALAIVRIIKDAGLQIGDHPVVGNITAVQACEHVYLARGFRVGGVHPAEFEATLKLICQAWGASPDGLRGGMIQGVGFLFLRDFGKFDSAVLASKLAKYDGGPLALLGAAGGIRNRRGGRMGDAVAELLVELYNKGRRVSKLEAWRS